MTIRYLSDIVQTVRDRGDYRNPVKFTDEIITREIQASFAELYQLIAGVQEGYFDTYTTLTTRENVAFVALPSDHWRMRALDLIDANGCVYQLDQVGIDQRNRYGTISGRPVAYRLTERGIDLYPTPDSSYTLRLLYTPSAPSLSLPIFVGSSNATFAIPDDPGDTSDPTLTTPSGVASGDTMLILIATDNTGLPESPPDGWYQAAELHSDNEIVLVVLRRTADGSESATYEVVMSGGNVTFGAMMLVYRNLDPIADLVDSAIVDVTSTRSFPCPTLDLDATTDLYVGVAWGQTGAASFAPPFASAERFDFAQASNPLDPVNTRQFTAFDMQPGAVGATGAKTAIAASALTGIAASLAFKVNPFREFFNGWEEYIVYGACIRLSGEEESTRSDWVTLQDRARQLAVGGATGRRSAEPQLIPLMDDVW